ncbi:GNAT superfamily N-acetyltransferase [Bradyrhizobium sp. LB7.1]
MHGTRIPLAKPDSRAITIRLARDLSDLMLVTSIRSAVYLAEQDCPFDEEFDGNDMVAAHFIGYVGNEPAGCLRVRFFGDFAKVERLAVRHQYRRSRVSFKLVQASVDYVKRKGFSQDLRPGAGPSGRFLGPFRRQAARPQSQGYLLRLLLHGNAAGDRTGSGRDYTGQRSLCDHPSRGRLGPAGRARRLGRTSRDVAAAGRRARWPLKPVQLRTRSC